MEGKKGQKSGGRKGGQKRQKSGPKNKGNMNRLCSKNCGIDKIIKNPKEKTAQRSNLNFLFL